MYSSISSQRAFRNPSHTRDDGHMLSHVAFYMQEAMWKSTYVLLSAFLCMCVCLHFFDVFLFHHAHLFFTTTHTDMFMTLDVTEAFSTMLVLCVYVTCVCVIPLCVYTFLTFVNPSCFRLEAWILLCVTGLGAMLFVCSYVLALHVVCPCVWHFFLFDAGHSWQYAPRLAPYVHLLVRVLCTMHVLCQLPCIACVLHVFWSLPQHMLACHRKTMHVSLLLVSAFVCPPDVLTQAALWFCLLCMLESVLFFVCVASAYSMCVKQHFFA
jgi:sec-independent protein translocase protein TatC